MTQINVKRVTLDQLESEIEDKQVEGYTLSNRSDNMAIMKRPGKIGAVWLHMILLLLTAGIGNLIYAYVTYSKTKSEVHIKVK